MSAHQTALQLQYTSCRRGQGSGKGFQTRAISEGLRPDEQREIEAAGGYTPPRDAPPEPEREQIELDFPVLFRFYRLGSGRFALTRSHYTGQDYSLRWGNFFAHSLVVADGAPAMWPVDHYEWDGWTSRLDAADDREDVAPPALPAVALDAIEPSPSFTFAELQIFLNEAFGRSELLAAMIRAVFFGPSRSRALVVRDSPLNGAFWLACVEKAFPLRHALNLTLSTFQFDARDCAALNATTSGTGFTFDETQRGFQFCMFDLIDGRHSEIPADGAEYASTVAGWMADRPGNLVGFHQFMAEVDHDAVSPDLVHFVRLFRVSIGDAGGLTIAEIVESLAFASRYLTPASRSGLPDAVARAAEWAASQGTPEQLLAVLGFLADDLHAGSTPTERTAVASTLLRCFDAIVAARLWTSLTTLAEGRDAIAARAPDVEREIAVCMFDDERVAAIGSALEAMAADDGAALEWLIGEVVRSAQTLGAASAWEYRPVRAVVAASSARIVRDRASAAALLRAFGDDARSITGACVALLFGCGTQLTDAETLRRGDLLGGALHDTLMTASNAVKAATRRALDTRATWPVLFGEWRAFVAAHAGNEELYAGYCSTVLAHVPGFDGIARTRIAREFADALAPGARARQTLAWLQTGEVNRFDREMERWCLTTAAALVPLALDARDGAAIAETVAHRARMAGVTLEPDRPFLRAVLERRALPNARIDALELTRLPAALQQLDRDDYVVFLRGFIPSALAEAHSSAEHADILRLTFLPARLDGFVEVYAAGLAASQGATALRRAEVVTALRFWLERTGDDDVPSSGMLIRPALDALTVRLVKMKHDDIETVERRLAPVDALTPSARVRWETMLEEVERRSRSVLSRVADFLRRDK